MVVFLISGNLHREKTKKKKHILNSLFPAAIFRSNFGNIGPSRQLSQDVGMGDICGLFHSDIRGNHYSFIPFGVGVLLAATLG